MDLPRLRRHWADSQKSPCGEATRCFHRYRWSEKPSFHLLCFLVLLSQRHWRHEILCDWILRNSPSFVLQLCPKIRRVCQCKFRIISFLIQAPRKTNDREGIYEQNSQLSVNCIHIFLEFLLLHIQCHCTLAWSWSCLRSSQVHTVGLSLDFESSQGSPTLWFLGILSTRTPSACRRLDSCPWSDCSPNTIQFYSSRLQQDHLPFLGTKYRVGEDVGFGSGILISSTVQ